MKTTCTIQKNWKTLLLSAFTVALGLQSMAQSPSSPGPQESMRVSLYQLNANGSINLADGNLTNYDDNFSDDIIDDAIKMNNFGENFGILRHSTKLAIEQRKKVYYTDTAFFTMWNMQIRNYRLIITTANLDHPGLMAELVDNYLNVSTPILLNDLNTIDFAINSTPASYATNRFKVVFRNPTLSPLATTFTGFTGRLGSNSIELQWVVNNESAMSAYIVERSVDGVTFSPIRTVAPQNASGVRNYASSDLGFIKADNFYRIKAISLNGAVQYSSILKISAGGAAQDILVYPNPIVNKKLTMQIAAARSGKYYFSLYNSIGSLIPLAPIEIAAGQVTQVIQLPTTIAPGVYRLRITTPENAIIVKTINVL